MLRQAVLFALVVGVLPLRAQRPASIDIIGAHGQRRTLTASGIAELPRQSVQASAHSVRGRFEGVRLSDVLRLVGTPSGDSLRGAALASYVLVEARDGYRVTFALAETNPSFSDRLILLVDRKDDAPLSEQDGPFQLIVPDEKRPGRWVRQVVRIRVVEIPAVRATQSRKTR